MFMTGSTYDNVVECDLTIPWDIRTANANFNNIIMENGDILVAQDGFNIVLEDSKFFAFGSQDATMNSITFSQNGARMFVTGTTNDKLFSYNLSTPWDVRTANYVSQLDLTPGTSPTGIFLNTDETKMFIIDSFLDRIRMFQIQPRLLNEDQTSLLSELSEYLVQQ
jgi:sugar lactone lactonase YvrE